jgi:hypothetical protein
MPRFSRATIYLLEDINDNRYIGSTSEKNINDRLNTHRRDEREHLLGIRNRNCSSMKLDLYHCNIIPLLECNNDWDRRRKWESYFMNYVYPECVNNKRFKTMDKKQYYKDNKERITIRNNNWREKNKEKVNAKRREYYQNNKERILQRRKELRLKDKNKI